VSVHEYKVEVTGDFIQRQAKAHPIQALAELIWNALDADATRVAVELKRNDLGGLSQILVRDNGHGMPHDQARDLFGSLGDSWKKDTPKSKKLGRELHGQEGRGRFRAFALGRAVDWKVFYDKNEETQEFSIAISEREISKFRISGESHAPRAQPGVVVTLSEIKRDFAPLEPEAAVQALSEVFAIYLKDYRDVSVEYDSEKIDPARAIKDQTEFSLTPFADDEGIKHDVSLEVIEWRHTTKRALFLCNGSGFPFTQASSNFHVGDFHFTAYLKSKAIEKLHQNGQLDLPEMLPELRGTIDEARQKIKELFQGKAAERARIVVDDWKEKQIYPFEGEPQTKIEQAERNIFDIVAVTVQDASPDFNDAPPKQAALHLRLLRSAIEKSPAELQRILGEVLKLPEKKQRELAQLLDETDLSGIIRAAKLVSDRLKFIEALKIILFEPSVKNQIKERSQLHKILEENTWVFGEEYNLWASDKDLTKVLKLHRSRLDPEIVIDDPVNIAGKKRGIIDLMLSRSQRRHHAEDIEHLVIELKAPKVVLNASHMIQIEQYALAVEQDERFHRVKGLRWHFWLISDEYDEDVAARIEGSVDPQRGVISRRKRVTIKIKSWSELIEENLARLQFVKEALQHKVDDGQALAHLQERHKQLLEGIFDEQSF